MENLIAYANHVGLDEFKMNWVKNVLSKHLKEIEASEAEHIIDFLSSEACPSRVGKMSYEQAKTKTEEWVAQKIKKGNEIQESPEDVELVLDFGDGFKIVKLVGQNAYLREGALMSHCVGSYFGRDVKVYSLRDSKNMPHCTIEEGKQIKGKGNGPVVSKYIEYIVKFLEHIGMDIRDQEMKNLGYVDASILKDKLQNKFFREKYLPLNEKWIDKEGNEYLGADALRLKPIIDRDDPHSVELRYDIKKVVEYNIALARKKQEAANE